MERECVPPLNQDPHHGITPRVHAYSSLPQSALEALFVQITSTAVALTSELGLCGVTICSTRFSDTSIALESPTQATCNRCSVGRCKTHSAVVPATIRCTKEKCQKNALNIRIVLKYATTSVIVGRSTHQFLRFLYEFVVQRDEGIAQCLCRPLGIVLAGRDFAMHVRYRICSRICATMTIEYGIVIRLRRRLFASHQCTPHTTDKEDETKKK